MYTQYVYPMIHVTSSNIYQIITLTLKPKVSKLQTARENIKYTKVPTIISRGN